MFDLDLLNLYRYKLAERPVIGCTKPDLKSLVFDGQPNCVSANIFIDSVVQYRQNLGLVVSLMDIGPADDVGYIKRTTSMQRPCCTTLLDLLQLWVTTVLTQRSLLGAGNLRVFSTGLEQHCALREGMSDDLFHVAV